MGLDRFGNGAINMLEARVVLANGTLVVASKCSYPDLFMSLRGGGGGVAGVVTEFTARSHPAPKYTSHASFSGTANTLAGCTRLFAKVMQHTSTYVTEQTSGEVCDNNGLTWSCDEHGGTASMSCYMYEGNGSAMEESLQPLRAWANSQGGSCYRVARSFLSLGSL